MEFKPHFFGVQIIENNISVDLIAPEELLKELPKYQFLLSDKIINDYNGNISYGINIQQLTSKEYIEFFGWKLISLKFLGNWYGQTGYWDLEDLNGIRKSISTTKHNWYHQNSKDMILESIISAKSFAQSNYSVAYTNFLDSVEKHSPSPSTNEKISLEKFISLISDTKKFIEDYQNVLATISDKNESRDISLIDELNKLLTNHIKMHYHYEIEMEADSKK
ncbi:hypothetical protein [uncultured Bacteroides sp.]|uniref:hypothetical protein n=1 Tax=uncultured Bacteroides sp. TaxID=162156 RepID=UPI00263A0C2D|nr:hypothetical protein [uncultured Bacteroides sp.]